jgi:hypothetical protein
VTQVYYCVGASAVAITPGDDRHAVVTAHAVGVAVFAPRAKAVYFERVNAVSVQAEKILDRTGMLRLADADDIPAGVVQHEQYVLVFIEGAEDLREPALVGIAREVSQILHDPGGMFRG